MSNIREECGTLEEQAYQLQDLARAFFVTGNEQMGKQLNWIAREIGSAADRIRTEDSRISLERLQDAEQSSFNLLHACLNADKIAEANRRFKGMGVDLDHLQSVNPDDPNSPQATVSAQLDEGA